MRAWIATALLAGSWLLGLDYFQPANYVAWIGFLAAAIASLDDVPIRLPRQRQMTIALVLLLPVVWAIPTPQKVIAALLAAGLALLVAPIPRRWPRVVGRRAVVAAIVVLAQSLGLWAYQLATSRSHLLPWPLVAGVAAAARLMGIETAVDGHEVAMRSMASTLRIEATWELLLDPASFCLLIGGLVLLALVALRRAGPGRRLKAWGKSSAILLAVTLAWAPVRAGLMLALVLHRSLRADAITAPNVGQILVSSWTHIWLLGGLLLLIIRLVPWPIEAKDDGSDRAVRLPDHTTNRCRHPAPRRQVAAAILVGTGVAVLTVTYWWAPVGHRKAGRIKVVERHSTWEPTTEPYGTKVYGEAGSYNYAAAYAFCQQYYTMSRLLESDSISDQSLADCDVLIIKTPTSRYTEPEVAAVVRFVQQGGAVLLIGDHTNVFNMNTYLNDIARPLGFTFRNDLLFKVATPYRQEYRAALVPHPAVQHLPRMNFAVSCSIDPGRSFGDMVIRSTGLWNLPPAYNESNYHPQAEYRPSMQYGAWCQLWSCSYGDGRVLAFADSTLFSNFCVFQEGKAELLVGMLGWLNHRSVLDRRGARRMLWLAGTLGGLVLLAGGAWLARGARGVGVLMVSIGLAAWCGASLAVGVAQRRALPLPRNSRPIPHVVIDRTLSRVPLFTGAFADDKQGGGYGMLEQWIPRVGNFTSRRAGHAEFLSDGLVIICPSRSVGVAYREQLVQYVKSGGEVLVIDSMQATNSTANSVLWPFGLVSRHDAPQQSPDVKLRLGDQPTPVSLSASCRIDGGEALAWWGEIPVAARARYGEGTVTAIGFGALFNDASMGFHWLPEPEADVLARYGVLYALLRDALPAKARPSRRGSFP